jgi:2-phospho-L-lactate guanylyltransferase
VGSSNVRVVTSDPVAQSYAMRLCIETYADGGHDLNSSLTSMINKEAADSVLILPIDLPRATRDALEPLLKVKNDVVIVPDRKQSGTNVLLLRRPVIEKFRFAFGEGSFAKHCAVAEALGNDPEIVNDDRLAFDIDNPDDYLAWRGAAR